MSKDQANTRLQVLRQQLQDHAYRYYVLDEPALPDADYDVLFQELLQLEHAYPELVTADSPSQRVGASSDTAFTPVTHQVPMLSLDNVFNAEDWQAITDCP